jgi:hypothetical protein
LHDQLGPTTDVYSLGAILYSLLTGQAPIRGHDVMLRIIQGDVPPPRLVNASVPRSLEAICLKALAVKPYDRYPSARALAEEVERWLADEPVTAWPEPFVLRARRWSRRNRTAVTAAAVGVLATVVGLSAVLVVQTRSKAALSRSLNRETRAGNALAVANTELSRSKAAVQARYDLVTVP